MKNASKIIETLIDTITYGTANVLLENISRVIDGNEVTKEAKTNLIVFREMLCEKQSKFMGYHLGEFQIPISEGH